MKYIVFILVVSAVVAQITQAQGFFTANLSGSVSGSVEIAGHRMNFTGEVRPRRHALAMNGTARTREHKHGHHGHGHHNGTEQ